MVESEKEDKTERNYTAIETRQKKLCRLKIFILMQPCRRTVSRTIF